MLISRILFFAGIITFVVCLATAIALFNVLETKTLYTYGAVSVIGGVVAVLAFNAIHYYDWKVVEEGRKKHERAYTSAQKRAGQNDFDEGCVGGTYPQDEQLLLPSQTEILRRRREMTRRQVLTAYGENDSSLRREG